jgi:hypothetical protein
MGKKWNILRERVDSCQYDITQLLVGTTIFTILLFILPTIAMYMLVFFYLRIIQFAVQFALRLCAVLVNKLTLTCLSSLHQSLQPQPITKARILVHGLDPCEYAKSKASIPYNAVDGKWCKLECFSVKEEDLTVLWNGKEYSINEMRQFLKDTPERTLINEMASPDVRELDHMDALVRGHSMAHWFWRLPDN